MQYMKQITKNFYDVIVIGSGLGGLSTAVNLTSKGLSVLVLEKHSIPGGALTTFKRNKFIFEAGASVFSGIKNVGPIHDLLKLTNSTEQKLIPIEPIYTVKTPNKTLEVSPNIQKYKKSLQTLFPNYKNNIEYFISDMIEICNSLKLINKKTNNFSSLNENNYLLKKYSNSSVIEFISKYFDNEEIIKILTSIGTFTTLPLNKQSFFTFVNIWNSYHMQGDLHIFEGGTKSFIDILVKYITDNNSEVTTSKKVSKIIVEENKAIGIETACGQIIKSKAVVSTISNIDTYINLLGEKYFEEKFINKIKNEVPSNSVLQVFLAIKDYERMKFKPSRKFIFNEINDNHFYNSTSKEAYDSKNYIYSIEPKSNSPEGTILIKIQSICKYKYFKNLYDNDKKAYIKFKEQISEELIDKLESEIPNLRNKIIYKNISTPVTIEKYTNVTNGAIHGLAFNISQSGKKRGSITTPIKNLYRAGQYVYPGGGIPPVVISGKLCSELVLNNHFNFVLAK